MPKVSRPVVYTALAALAAYALVLNTQPDTPTARRVVRTTRIVQTADPNGVLPEDLSARFSRYAGGKRDPFTPGVVLTRPKTVSASAGHAQTGWALTGISSVNGVASALIENGATGESVFLQPGDRWNGLRVVSIRSDKVLFLNALGRTDTLTFAQPADEKTGAAGAAPRSPSVGLSLPPYPVTPLQVTPPASGPASLPVLPSFSGNAAPPAPNDNAPPDGQ